MTAVHELPELGAELIALAYLHQVERQAAAAWRSGHDPQLLATVAQVCADRGIDPLGDPQVNRLAAVHAGPGGQYVVKVVLAACALFEHDTDAGFALLAALMAGHHTGWTGGAGPGVLPNEGGDRHAA